MKSARTILLRSAWPALASLVAIAGAEPPPPEMRLEALPARAPEPPGNPSTPAKIELGRLLFFDPILSATGDVACATCHHPALGWADGRATPVGVGGSGLGPARTFRKPHSLNPLPRNAPTLLNVGFNGLVAGQKLDPARAPMFWDSRVESLEQQVFAPIRSREEMRGDACPEAEAVPRAVARVGAIAEYRERFASAFGGAPGQTVTAERLALAVAAFERTLVAGNSPFDRFMRGDTSALNSEQQQGMRVFQEAGCVFCHGGPMFSDYKLHFIGVGDFSRDGRREFRTPTLRNLKSGAPYMHDGSQPTLERVVLFYDELMEAVAETLDGGDHSAQPPLDPLLQRLNLADTDFPALLSFLDALNDDDYDRGIPAKAPSGLPVAGGEPSRR